MFARVSHFQEEPDNIDESDRVAREEILPMIEGMAGFLGLLSLADRATGRTLAITFWESEEAMATTESAADELRERSVAPTGGQVGSVERYEVTIRFGI